MKAETILSELRMKAGTSRGIDSDVRKISFMHDCSVITLRNMKLRKKPAFSRGFPRWFGIFLRVYLQLFRHEAKDDDLFFIDPASGDSLNSKFPSSIRPYLVREYNRFIKPDTNEEFVGGNLKRKVFSTCLKLGRSEYVSQVMEHSERTSDLHYAQQGFAAAVETYRLYLDKIDAFCELEGANLPREWVQMASVPEEDCYDDFWICDLLRIRGLSLANLIKNN